ncbi:class I SAM-dependent methyltransferase [Brevibacillus ruminantium]|uniref:Class I SAM-dependent methyltransferase n=1 Tax=Brevibacillus ruminantium TaxID=2950604 RepID=A0ABY4WIR1_9BACL|nr:class I SAM-dependent methyltransferase [Brevibacillus ruminantium]USG66038.1 class I SAM-dependent methyltransferase [Brevibacillus ruminantium]
MADHYYTSRPGAEHDEQEFTFTLRGYDLRFITDAGVFSRDRVDFGSQLLIETMELDAAADVLDVGCGYGPMGLTAAKLAKDGHVTMIDVNERAVELAKRNARVNGISNVEILVSDVYSAVQGRVFDVILTNPPIRAGKEIVHRIFTEGYELLREGGEMWVVIQKKQGAPSALRKLQEVYQEVEEVDKKKGYYIYRAKKS